MLLGEHEHTLDDKNRLTLPAKLREQLGEELVVTRGLDGCLAVYSREGFELLAARVGTLDPFSPEIYAEHLLCAAHEAPLSAADEAILGPQWEEHAKALTSAGMLRERATGFVPPLFFQTSPVSRPR